MMDAAGGAPLASPAAAMQKAPSRQGANTSRLNPVSKLAAKLRELERWGSASPGHTWILIGGVIGAMLLVLVVAITLAAIYTLPSDWWRRS